MEVPFDLNDPEQREKIRRLFRVKRIEGEMLKNRGYRLDSVYMMRTDRTFTNPVNLEGLQNPNIPLDSLIDFIRQQNIFRSRLEFSSIYFKEGEESDRVLVLYLSNNPGKQVSTKDFAIVKQFIQTGEIRHIIIITETGLGTDSQSYIRTQVDNRTIEVFLDQELAFNRTKHALAPIKITHIISTDVSEWAEQEGLQPEKLPMILNVDPIAKWYGAKPFDVFQTVIMGTETDTIGYYRLVRQTSSGKRR